MIALLASLVAFGISVAEDELAVQHPLSDAAIAEAIVIGQDGSMKLPRLFFGSSGSDFGGARSDSNRNNSFMEHQTSVKTRGYGVELYTPYAWVARLSRNAAERGKTLVPGQLTDAHLGAVLRIVCHGDVPQEFREGAYGTLVESVILVSANKQAAEPLLPLETTRTPEKIRAPSGELIDKGPLVGSFDLGQLAALSSQDKKGEFYVVIVAANGETKRFKVKSKHFKELR